MGKQTSGITDRLHRGLGLSIVSERAMSRNGNPCPSPGGLGNHLGGFPMSHYPYFFPHMLGGLSPPALPGLPVSGYSTPSPASEYPSFLVRNFCVLLSTNASRCDTHIKNCAQWSIAKYKRYILNKHLLPKANHARWHSTVKSLKKQFTAK